MSEVQAMERQGDYATLMEKARRLDADGDTVGARQAAEAALEARRLELRRKALIERQRQVKRAVEQFEASGDASTDALSMEALARLAAERKASGSLGKRIGEFLFGDDDPTTQNLGEKIGTALNKAGESLTLGIVGDEASAALESVLPGVDYATRRDYYRQQKEQFTEDHPYAAIIAELAPLAIPGVGAAGVAGKGTSLASRMVRGGAVAGAQGATYGFTEGEGGIGDRLEAARDTGGLSAGIGAVSPAAGRSIQRALDRRAGKKAVNNMIARAPSAEQLKSGATRHYTAGTGRGTIASAGDAQALVDDVTATLKREGVMRANGDLITRDPDARRILEELQDIATHGLEGNQVKPVRDIFKAAARDSDPARARIGRILQKKFDDFVSQRAPEFADGDALYARAKKVDAVEQMVDLADTSDNASALRNEFRKADRNQIKGRFGGMTDDEVSAIQRVARGSRVENVARAAGKSAPRSIGSALYTGGVPLTAGSLAGSPAIGAAVGGAALGAGMIGQALSNRMQSRHAEIAKALMATGGQMPNATASEALKRRIAQALAGLGPRAAEMAGGL